MVVALDKPTLLVLAGCAAAGLIIYFAAQFDVSPEIPDPPAANPAASADTKPQPTAKAAASASSTVRRRTFQFVCSRCQGRPWWGRAETSTCFSCSSTVACLPFEQMTGLGIYKCDCGNEFKRSVRSDNREETCRRCGRTLQPRDIVKP
eukprot:TRINITY_DN6317_c0_g1_i1.p1 TRINITY_DN6317_c0_g1~~TRINITY_DN6317_c0_g1_i1.p1  ORF type:complete len:149 (-),score=24.53 TRINITY_DN6317_c0_g1_i1:83-529(-)